MVRSLLTYTTSVGILFFTCLPSFSDPLPDLVPSISDLSIQRGQSVPPEEVADGCANGTTNRTLLRFSTTASNVGAADIIIGHPDCPDCIGEPPPACNNPQFVCNIDEHEAEFASYASYQLVKSSGGRVVARGHKQGFCVEDVSCNDGVSFNYTCDNQGITAGCSDTYSSSTRCQYIDVTDVKAGKYLLHVEVNPLRTITEGDFANNISESPVTICGGSSILNLKVVPPVNGFREFYLKTSLTIPSRLTINPLLQGLPVSLAADGTQIFNETIPAGKPGKGCGPSDGWTTVATGKIWRYRNDTGFLDLQCFNDAGGIRYIQVTKEGKRYDIEIQGRLPIYTLSVPPQYLEFASNVDSSIFNCIFSHASHCRKGGPRKQVLICN